MAKEKKSTPTLTVEEKLQAALVPKDEQPYKIPDTWRWIYAPSIFKIEYGKGLSSKQLEESGFPVFGANGLIGYYSEYMYDDEQALMSCRGAYSGVMNKSVPKSYVTSNSLVISSETKDITADYICYLFSALDVSRLISGSAQPQVTVQSFEMFPIPLPPIKEQQRIVARIESLFSQLDEAKDKAQEVIDGFDSRRAAILAQAFSGKLTEKWREEIHCYRNNYLQEIDQLAAKIGRKNMKKVQNDFADDIATIIPNSWASTDLERIARKITDGEHKTPKRVSEYCGYYLLSARNVRNGAISLEDVDYVDKDEYEKISKRCNPTVGDVLISCSGSVGRVCVVEDNNKYCMVRSAAVISLLAGVPRFVMYMLQSNYVQEQIKALTKQTAQANLFLGAISALVIPFPSKEEQEKIVEILDRILLAMEEAKEIAEKTIEEIDLIKKSILTKAFRGKLGTCDPSDASALNELKNILSKEEKPMPKSRSNKIPKKILNLIETETEKKIVRYLIMNDKAVSLEDISGVASDTFDIIENVNSLEKKQVIKKLKNGLYRMMDENAN